MYKCPKCDYQSENPGNCPTDNEVLIEAASEEASANEPVATDEPSSEEIPTENEKTEE